MNCISFEVELRSVYHGVAGETGLQLEDFVKTSCLSLGQFFL